MPLGLCQSLWHFSVCKLLATNMLKSSNTTFLSFTIKGVAKSFLNYFSHDCDSNSQNLIALSKVNGRCLSNTLDRLRLLLLSLDWKKNRFWIISYLWIREEVNFLNLIWLHACLFLEEPPVPVPPRQTQARCLSYSCMK